VATIHHSFQQLDIYSLGVPTSVDVKVDGGTWMARRARICGKRELMGQPRRAIGRVLRIRMKWEAYYSYYGSPGSPLGF
jgi:hypothetical protein